eukprot:13621929-Alexandrium_andersonii.AAC.1
MAARGLPMFTTAHVVANFWSACAPLVHRARSSVLPALIFKLCAGVASRRREACERVLVGLRMSRWSSRLAEWWAEC